MDPEALEAENDERLDELGAKVKFLRQVRLKMALNG